MGGFGSFSLQLAGRELTAKLIAATACGAAIDLVRRSSGAQWNDVLDRGFSLRIDGLPLDIVEGGLCHPQAAPEALAFLARKQRVNEPGFPGNALRFHPAIGSRLLCRQKCGCHIPPVI
jgi:hypothetical protein